jgi:hypothetical protein
MTKPDLSRQSIIPSGSTASFDGSINIGEKLLVQDIEFVVSGITSGQTLVYNSVLNKLLPTSIDLNASSTLSGMTDVNFTTLTSGDTILWNSTTNKWENNNIVLNTDSIINTSTVTGSTTTNALDNLNANKADLVAGKIPSSQLPSYVDDVIEGYYYTSNFYEDSGHTISITGETSKIYIDLPTNLTYRWSGSIYIEISTTTLLGTTDRITVSGNTIDIASTYTGQTSINTVGGITTGSWSGTPINDTYISSASTWNAKQSAVTLTVTGTSGSSTFTTGGTLNIPTYTLSGLGGQPQLNGNGFVRSTGTTIDYLSGTTNQFVKADGSLDSNSYSISYTIPNYYKVNYTTGSDVTGVAGRTDKPYATLQTVWDLIATGNTTSTLIEIEGEYTFTTHAINTSVVKNNITFTFLNDIIYNVNSTTISRPLFTFSDTCSNLTFNCPTFTMTKQGGFLVMAGGSSANINFNTVNALMGIDTSINLNVNLVRSVPSGVFNCNNLNVSVTNDSNGIKGYSFLFGSNTSMIYNIGIVTYSGAPTVASTSIYMFVYGHGIINIKKFISNITTYTNITAFGFDYSLQCSIVNVDEVTIASSTPIKGYPFLNPGLTTIQYNIKKMFLLNSQTLITGSAILNLGYFEYNGLLSGTFNGTLNFEYLKNTATLSSSDTAFLSLRSNTKINGVGRGVWEYTQTTFLSNTMSVVLAYGDCNARISNVTFYGSGMQTGNVNSFIPIRFYQTGAKLRLDNVIFTTNLDTNTHANTTPIMAYGESAGYTCTIEGNFSTNYLLNVTGLTNNCEVDLISGYIV